MTVDLEPAVDCGWLAIGISLLAVQILLQVLSSSNTACDVAAVQYLLTEAGLRKGPPPTIDVGALARYDRPMPTMAEYAVLLSAPCAGTA